MSELTHFNEDGRARMVNIGGKSDTQRTATAAGRILVSPETLALIKDRKLAKGDVLGTAQIGGIMGAKRTPDIIPMCHPILLTGVDLSFSINEADCCVDIEATASCTGATGVEMEAMTAVSVAALTIYDMCKAVQKDIVIDNIRLLKKTGGKSGVFIREADA
jgi:cyclic pyranopterin phosphate synthase